MKPRPAEDVARKLLDLNSGSDSLLATADGVREIRFEILRLAAKRLRAERCNPPHDDVLETAAQLVEDWADQIERGEL